MAVRTTQGLRVTARRAVIADTSAISLYRDLLPASAVPTRIRADLQNFEWDTPVVKINYALDAPIPWRARNLHGAGTVHLGADERELVRWMADLDTAVLPRRPFMLFGQMTTADASRSPAGYSPWSSWERCSASPSSLAHQSVADSEGWCGSLPMQSDKSVDG